MKRVISLLPSCSEIIGALHCADQLVGRSHACDFPSEIRAAPVCTLPLINPEASSAEMDCQAQARRQQGLALVEVDTKKMAQLHPDLVFAQNPLPDLGIRVVEFAPRRVIDLWTDIQRIADELEVSERGHELVFALKNRLVDVLAKTCMFKSKPTVGCIEWIEPLRSAGRWVPDLVEFAGGQNLFSKAGEPSSLLDWATLAKANPEVIVLMPCGFNLERTRRELGVLESKPEWRKLDAVKHKKVFMVDSAQYFSRPGPRLMESQEILAQIVHPTSFRFGGEGKTWQKM